MKNTIYQLKITLQDTQPVIWRRIQVPAAIKLGALHRVLQTIMDWTDSHLHEYRINDRKYGEPDPEFEDGTLSERNIALSTLLKSAGDKMLYTYDFGDDWNHAVELEQVLSAESDVTCPICIAGERSAPPEDCGGPYGYQNFLEAIQNPRHSEHGTMMEWIGGIFDPEQFDLNQINKQLKRAAK